MAKSNVHILFDAVYNPVKQYQNPVNMLQHKKQTFILHLLLTAKIYDYEQEDNWNTQRSIIDCRRIDPAKPVQKEKTQRSRGGAGTIEKRGKKNAKNTGAGTPAGHSGSKLS